MSAREKFYVDWKHVIKDTVPRIKGDPGHATEVRIVGWDYHLTALAAARDEAIEDAMKAVVALVDTYTSIENPDANDVLADAEIAIAALRKPVNADNGPEAALRGRGY